MVELTIPEMLRVGLNADWCKSVGKSRRKGSS